MDVNIFHSFKISYSQEQIEKCKVSRLQHGESPLAKFSSATRESRTKTSKQKNILQFAISRSISYLLPPLQHADKDDQEEEGNDGQDGTHDPDDGGLRKKNHIQKSGNCLSCGEFF